MLVSNITPGQGINVMYGATGTPWIDMNRPSAGLIRFNNGFEVYDGNNWVRMAGSSPTVELDAGSQAAIRWATQKIEDERRYKELAANNPAVQDALDALQRAEEQLKIVAALVDNA